MLNVGVVGCGHLGKIHVKLLSQSENYSLVGIYDKNIELSKSISKDLKCNYFKSFDELLDSIDVLNQKNLIYVLKIFLLVYFLNFDCSKKYLQF